MQIVNFEVTDADPHPQPFSQWEKGDLLFPCWPSSCQSFVPPG